MESGPRPSLKRWTLGSLERVGPQVKIQSYNSPLPQQGVGCGRQMLACESVLKLRLTLGGSSSTFGNIEIKVASKHDRQFRVTVSGIVERFAKLRAP
jgi:hypothetical protein